MTREEIEAFFEGVIIDGCTRKIIFLEESEEGRLEVDLVAPQEAHLPTVHLNFPDEQDA